MKRLTIGHYVFVLGLMIMAVFATNLAIAKDMPDIGTELFDLSYDLPTMPALAPEADAIEASAEYKAGVLVKSETKRSKKLSNKTDKRKYKKRGRAIGRCVSRSKNTL